MTTDPAGRRRKSKPPRAKRVAARRAASVPKNEGLLAGIIRCSVQAIIAVDENQRIILFNPMAENIFLCPADYALGRLLGDFIPDRFRSAHASHVRHFGAADEMSREMGKESILYGLRRDGGEFPVEAFISQTIGKEGGKLFTVMLRDATERVRAETELRNSLDELQQLSSSILTRQEDEKRQISRELHDDLGQRLSALKMNLAMVEADLHGAGSSRQILDQVSAMHDAIDATVASVRRIAADLRPTLLDELGLVDAIEWLAKDFSGRYGIKVVTESPNEIEAVDETATAVFRIVQEALRNVVHHAGAGHVQIRIHSREENLEVSVRDDGRGWDGNSAGGERGTFGLLGIRERARLLGGSVLVTLTPGQGLELAVTFHKSALGGQGKCGAGKRAS